MLNANITIIAAMIAQKSWPVITYKIIVGISNKLAMDITSNFFLFMATFLNVIHCQCSPLLCRVLCMMLPLSRLRRIKGFFS